MSNAGYAKATGGEVDPVIHKRDDHFERTRITHPAFAKIRVGRVQGHMNLAGIDYPQQHHIRLSISTAELDRGLSRDWWHAKEQVIEVALSETQWAEMLSAMNTDGTPCTLTRFNPANVPHVHGMVPELPPRASEANQHISEVKASADRAIAEISEAEDMLSGLLDATGSISKASLREVLGRLRKGRRQVSETLPFVVSSADETISESATRARAEVQSFTAYAMQQIGEKATGAYLLAKAAQGVEPEQALIEMIAPAVEAERADQA